MREPYITARTGEVVQKKQSLLPIRWTAGTAALAGRPHICSPQGRAELRPTGVLLSLRHPLNGLGCLVRVAPRPTGE